MTAQSFAALAMWGLFHADEPMKTSVVLGAIAAGLIGGIVPYARARAEGVGYLCIGGACGTRRSP